MFSAALRELSVYRGLAKRRAVSASRPLGWSELQAEVATIVGRLNDDQSLARAAAVNPLYAIEELGYATDPAQRPEIEDRLRFRPRDAARLRQLRRRIIKEAERTFDPASDDEVLAVLRELDVLPVRTAPKPAGGAYQQSVRRGAAGARPEPHQAVLRKDELAELLEPLRDAHPVVEPLLVYRRLELSEPRLAPRDLFDEVRRGVRKTPVTSIRAVLKSRRR